jgi:hypothetical protein
MTATEVLRNHGINVPFAAPGRIYATCPKCSHTRQQSHQKKKCLGITIDDESVHWGCNHCDWTGGERFDKSNGHDRGIVTYNYCDESGVVLFQKVRTPDKKFWQRRPDGNGGWINSLGETRKVLYRLPELIEDVANDHMVLIVEGEKEPGTGKSQISVAIAATLTTGGEWPCGEGRAPLGSVIILSAEDGAADTIVPRLIAAGADLTRVHIVSSVSEIDGKGRRAFNLQTDITLLERKISEIGDVVLVIVDPVSSYMGKTDSHKNSEVRGVLEPLSDMADRTRTAILTITHFSKAGAASSTKALHRFIGSIAFTGAPRAAFAVIDDAENEGRKLFLHAKNNLAAPPQGLAFRLEQTIVADNIVASRVAWDGEPVIITANQALAAEAAGDDSRTARGDAEEFLRELLASGPVPQKEVKDAAEGAGLAWATVRRAKERLGVEAIRETETEFGKGTGRWLWRLRCSSLP